MGGAESTGVVKNGVTTTPTLTLSPAPPPQTAIESQRGPSSLPQ